MQKTGTKALICRGFGGFVRWGGYNMSYNPTNNSVW